MNTVTGVIFYICGLDDVYFLKKFRLFKIWVCIHKMFLRKLTYSVRFFHRFSGKILKIIIHMNILYQFPKELSYEKKLQKIILTKFGEYIPTLLSQKEIFGQFHLLLFSKLDYLTVPDKIVCI